MKENNVDHKYKFSDLTDKFIAVNLPNKEVYKKFINYLNTNFFFIESLENYFQCNIGDKNLCVYLEDPKKFSINKMIIEPKNELINVEDIIKFEQLI